MAKKLKINTGQAILIKNPPEAYSEYESIKFNAGSVLISRQVYDTLIRMNVSFNTGQINILDIEGEVVELPSGTVVDQSSNYEGCYIICEGNLIVTNKDGLQGITGLYANRIFYPQSLDLSSLKGIVAANRIAYEDDAVLWLKNMILDENMIPSLEKETLYWVHGSISALKREVLEEISQKSISFHCKSLTIYQSLFEEYSHLFQAEKLKLIPDGYRIAQDVLLDANTFYLYGEKLFVQGDLTVQKDQAVHLKNFTSIIVKGTATLPSSAASDCENKIKAEDYDLYQGLLKEGNGKVIIDHELLQYALDQEIEYALRANGELLFKENITLADLEAISSIGCNGVISASSKLHGALEAKTKYLNGVIVNLDDAKSLMGDEAGVTQINTGLFRF